MRVGIVGAGNIFYAHAEAYRALGVEIVAIADIDGERARAAGGQYGVKSTLSDWKDIIDRDDVDIVDICGPAKLHTPVALAALKKGKHVVCEKPLAPTLAQADEVVRAANAGKSKAMVVHQMRYDPCYQALKWLVTSGSLGRICLARQVRYGPVPDSLVKNGTWGNWEVSGGGVVMTQAIHQLDALLWLLGKARRVQAMTCTGLFPIESEDQAVVNIEFDSGVLATLCVSGSPYGRLDEFDLIGDRGTASYPLRVAMRDSRLQNDVELGVARFYPRRTLSTKLQKVWGRFAAGWRTSANENQHLPILGAFLGAVAGRGEVPVTVEEGRDAVELCTAVYASAITHAEIRLPLDQSNRFYGGVSRNDFAREC